MKYLRKYNAQWSVCATVWGLDMRRGAEVVLIEMTYRDNYTEIAALPHVGHFSVAVVR